MARTALQVSALHFQAVLKQCQHTAVSVTVKVQDGHCQSRHLFVLFSVRSPYLIRVFPHSWTTSSTNLFGW